jgi:hypothetical protein
MKDITVSITHPDNSVLVFGISAVDMLISDDKFLRIAFNGSPVYTEVVHFATITFHSNTDNTFITARSHGYNNYEYNKSGSMFSYEVDTAGFIEVITKFIKEN